MRKFLSVLLVLALAIVCFQGIVLADDGDTVLIIHTNDVHGYLESEYDDDGNLTKLGMEHVAAVHKAHPDSILVDAGDFSQGATFAGLAHGLSVYETMNAAGYDIAALGNHEFDWGVAEFEENIKVAQFEVICANVSVSEDFKDVSPYLYNMKPYTVREVNGHKIAFFALDTAQLNGMVSPSTLKAGGVETRADLSNVAKETVELIKKEAPDVQAIVAITHCGYSEESTGSETSYDVAKVDGVDVVIDAHDHENRLGDLAKNVDGTLVVSTGTALQHIGGLELTFDGDKLSGVRSFDIGEEAKTLEGDADTKAVIDSWNAKFDEIRNQVVFSSDVNLWGGNLNGFDAHDEAVTASIARRGYTNAGALMTDSILWQAKKWLAENYESHGLDKDIPIVAYFGGGSVRGTAKAGEITLGALMSVYSFSFEDAEDSYVLVTPKILYDLVEHGVNFISEQDPETGFLTADGSVHGRFPHFSGMDYVYDVTQPASHEYDKENMKMPDFIGTRVVSITLDDGTVLDRNDNETKIMLCTGSYQIGGGDSYWMQGLFNDEPDYGGYQYVEFIDSAQGNQGDHLIDYVNEVYGGHITAEDYPIHGTKFQRVNDPYTKDTFDSKVTVTKSGEDPIANTKYTVYVNGEAKEFTTDGEGKFVIEGLQNGPNEIRIIGDGYDSGSIYLDNYCGLQNPVAVNAPGEIAPGTTVEAPKTEEPVSEPAAEPASEPAEPAVPAKKSNATGWVIGVIAVAAVAGCGYYFLKKKKSE